MTYTGAGFILLSPDCTHTLLVNDARSKKWGFPKGHKEKEDADDLATAIRECEEETGLIPNDYMIKSDVFRVSKGSQSYLFRYVLIKPHAMNQATPHPDFTKEIRECRWVPILDLLKANHIYDGNKYLRNWISDIQHDISKKSVYLFKKLCSLGFASGPSHESVGSPNVVTCA
jgi:8-oxo-dGTP pyrophosphatase MutT (NUDIX family)